MAVVSIVQEYYRAGDRAQKSGLYKVVHSGHRKHHSVVVVRGDSVVYARGFGVADIETAAPMTPDLLAQVGSLTKPFTAACTDASRPGW